MTSPKKWGSSLAVAFLLITSGCGGDSSDSPGPSQQKQEAGNASETPPPLFVSEGERLNLDVHLASMNFTGYVEIGSVEADGSLTARVNISGMSSPTAVTGQIRGASFEVDDFLMDHDLATGTIKNLRGSIVSTSRATGTFSFLIQTSDIYPSLEGYEFAGSFTLSRGEEEDASSPSSSSSIAEFIILNHTYDIDISIAGFGLSASARLTTYDEVSGEFVALFVNEEYDFSTNVAGLVRGNTLEFDPFRVTSPFVTGMVRDMEGTFDESSGEVRGTFRFQLEESPLFEEYVGGTFGGSFTVRP